MPIINEKIVLSRCRKNQIIIAKAIHFNDYGNIQIKDVLSHNEIVKEVRINKKHKYVEIVLNMEIYFNYSIERKNEITTNFTVLNEDVILNVSRDEFRPKPYESDYLDNEIVCSVRNLRSTFDIDLNGQNIIIKILGTIVLNILKERCINVAEVKHLSFNDICLNQVAVSTDLPGKNVRESLQGMGTILEGIVKYVDEIEDENNDLKEELKELQIEIQSKISQYMEEKLKSDAVSMECSRLLDRVKGAEEKYLKECRRSNLLETENSRNIDEIKKLRRENEELTKKLDKNKDSWTDKLKKLVDGK